MFSRKLRALVGFVALVALAACGGSGGQGADDASSGTSGGDESNTLHIIGGSELKDLEPLFGDIAKGSGVHIAMTYSGTLAGVDRLKGGEKFDAAWFANAKYLLLNDTQHHVRASERIMLSPIVFGVKESVAKKFGWTTSGTSWKDLAARAGSGDFRYAMTNPASSNSGFSATIAVASAFAGTGDVLRPSDVDEAKLKSFFRGQKLASGSSGWLIDGYVHDQDTLDGLVNYEASIIALNDSGKLHEKLALIYPKEGTITADYPLLLLDDAKKPLYDKLVAYLKSDDFQQRVMQQTDRRPVNPNVKLGPAFPTALVNEVSFPNSLAAVDGILEAYLNENRVPAHAFYVLDTSGSMEGERIDGVRKALYTLANGDASLTGKFARFENREKISLISFSDNVTEPVDLEMHSASDATTLGAVRKYADDLQAGGSTAIYCALETALEDAAKASKTEPNRYYSIVLMTDGENNKCDDESDFERKYAALPARARIKIFPILFGEGDPSELKDLAALTGGRLFDGTSEPLSEVFKDIRGYQ